MGKNNLQDSILKILAVIGAVSILSLGGFLTITVLRNIPAVFNTIKAQVVNVTENFIPIERIVVTVNNQNPTDGDIIKLSFEHLSKNEDGSYSFFYECREGIYFEKVLEFSPTGDVIFCNTPYNFVNSNNTLSFAVFTNNDNIVQVPLSINFVRNNSETISHRGAVTISIGVLSEGGVSDGGTVLVTNNNSPKVSRTYGKKIEETALFNNTSISTQGTSNPNGFIDLKPKIIAVGQIDKSTNIFTATSTILTSSRGAVKFEVENVGTKISPSWTFNVVLPTFPSYIYHSKMQQSLLPGDRIEYTIGFDSIRSDGLPNTIIVNADPISSIKESDEVNNIVRTELQSFR